MLWTQNFCMCFCTFVLIYNLRSWEQCFGPEQPPSHCCPTLPLLWRKELGLNTQDMSQTQETLFWNVIAASFQKGAQEGKVAIKLPSSDDSSDALQLLSRVDLENHLPDWFLAKCQKPTTLTEKIFPPSLRQFVRKMRQVQITGNDQGFNWNWAISQNYIKMKWSYRLSNKMQAPAAKWIRCTLNEMSNTTLGNICSGVFGHSLVNLFADVGF